MRRLLSRASWQRLQVGALVLVVATVALLASRAPGYPVTKLDLNDTGIWISNGDDGYFGRVNTAAVGLDARLGAPKKAPGALAVDVLQDGNMVLGLDGTDANLFAISAPLAMPLADALISMPEGGAVDMRGGTVALMDARGKVWATRYDASGEGALDITALDSTVKPIADLGLKEDQPAGTLALTVDSEGVIYAASASGPSVRVAPGQGSAFESPAPSTAPTLTSVQLAAIGTALVTYDAAAGLVTLPGGKTATVPADPHGRLQASGPGAAGVLVASGTDLTRIDLATGNVDRLFGAGDGEPAQPVRLGDCDFAAWAGKARYVRQCGAEALSERIFPGAAPLKEPVFRINHGRITLNDKRDGRAFDLEKLVNIANWDQIEPKKDAPTAPPKDTSSQNDKVKANDDDLKARAGRTTVLHVLDNDKDASGGAGDPAILMIQPTLSGVQAGVTVTVSPDAQTLLVAFPDSIKRTSFRYTIVGASGATDSATVTVTNAGNEDRPPYLVKDARPPVYTAAALGSLSIPVAQYWRDPEGDPVAVVQASDADATVPVTSDGRLEYTAPSDVKGATHKLVYRVTDNLRHPPVDGAVQVLTLGQNETKTVPATAEPDTAQGKAGRPIVVWPLANDVPGADPNVADARLYLPADVARTQGLTVVTDQKAGSVTITGKRGSYLLSYQAGYGDAAPRVGQIRVDIAGEVKDAPVAVPDQAAVHGSTAVLVDVLANDYDPAGGMLTVESADTRGATAYDAAVIAGRWIRVVPTASVDGQQVVHYTISNGTATAVGDLVVTPLDAVDKDAPLAQDDFAVVRSGDSVLIPVLANDSSASGSPLTLVTNSLGNDTAGQLTVQSTAVIAGQGGGDVGTAYIHSNQIRYVAPAQLAQRTNVVIGYIVQTQSGESATAKATVTINPEPTADTADQAPTPGNVEMRVASGSRVVIPVPTSGSDPDGDTVSVAGITSAPKLGRVIAFGPSSVTYEAYPTDGLTGTDSFSYAVTDRYGQSGEATIRVAVTAPGQTQPPVAIDDSFTASPGAKLQLNVMANDLVGRDDKASIVPLVAGDSAVPASVSLAADRGPILATVPAADSPRITFNYALKGNGGSGPSATVSVDSEDGYNNPPNVRDQTAEASGKAATADLLAGAWDAEGDTLSARLLQTPEGATLEGSKVTIPLSERAQAVPFEVRDAAGATTAAVVYVPALGAGAPVLKPGASIHLDQNGSLTLPIADYVISPRGRPVRLRPAQPAGTPSDALGAERKDASTFAITSKGDPGPGALVVEVMDGESPNDPDVLQATISIPVQVGPSVPVLRCPSDPQKIVQGGEIKSLDITTLCHVWAPDPATLSGLTYTATWTKQPADVTASAAGSAVNLQAGSNAKGKETGELTIGVADSPAKTAKLQVVVVDAPLPTLADRTYSGVKQGTSFDVMLAIHSPLLNPQYTIRKVAYVDGPSTTATPAPSGTKITFTPAVDVHGPVVFRVTASDVSDPASIREVTGTITLLVYGKPGRPGKPQPGNTVLSRTVALTWPEAASNGARIDKYEVTAHTPQGDRTMTVSSRSVNFTGLQNGDPVTFQVRAHNKAGWGEPSEASRQVKPDEPPGAPTGVVASQPQDHQLTLTWNAPPNGGSAITNYIISWPGHSQKIGNTRTFTARGLDNNTRYTFKVAAKNSFAKPGPAGSGTGQSSGKPLGLTVNVPSATPIDAATTPVRVSWSAVDPNGPSPVTYVVTRNDGRKVCTTTSTSCVDAGVAFDGASYKYTVAATNATGGAAHTSTASSPVWKAVGKPGAWSSFSATPTGRDGEVQLTYTVPPSRGGVSKVTLNGASGTISSPGTGGGSGSKLLTGLNDGTTYSLSLELCNEDSCSTSQTQTATPYGPLAPPTVENTGVSGTTVTFRVTADGNGNSATLNISASNGTCSGTGSHDTGVSQRTVDVSCDVGYSSNATLTATLTDDSPSRNGGSRQLQSPTTPSPPKTVHIYKSTRTQSGCTYWNGGGPCPYVALDTSGFGGATFTCQAYNEGGGSWGPTVTYRGDQSGAIYYYNGFKTTVYLICGGAESNHVAW